MLANLEAILEAEIPLEELPLFEKLDRVRRVEFASVGSSARNFRQNPKLALLMILDAGLSESERDSIASELLATLESLVDEDREGAEDEAGDDSEAREEAAAETKPADSEKYEMHPGGLRTLDVPSGHALAPFHYAYGRTTKPPHIFLGYGLDDIEAHRQYTEVRKSGGNETYAPIVIHGETSALAALMTTYQPPDIDYLDIGILAQRLGALDARMQIGERSVRFTTSLSRPPRLR
jgi:hypothetical protein